MNIEKMKELSNRIDVKLQSIDDRKSKSEDVLLTKDLLMFLKFLVNKELKSGGTIFPSDNDYRQLFANPDELR